VLRSAQLRLILVCGALGVVAGVLVHARALVLAALAATLLGAAAAFTRGRLFDGLGYARRLSRPVVGWGDEVEVSLEVTNHKWLPVLWLRLRDRWPAAVEPLGFGVRYSGERTVRILDHTYALRWWERVARRHRGRCRERGVHEFGPATAEAGDPLGVSSVERALPGVDRLLVLPKVLAVPDLVPLFGLPQVDAPARVSLARDPTGLVGSRPYRRGDPPRLINWRATARSRELVTNLFEPTVTAQAMICLNLRAVRHIYEGFDAEVMELLCVVGASLAAGVASLGFAVGLLSNAQLTRAAAGVTIEPTADALGDVLETLARVALWPPMPFERLLAAEAAAPRDATDYLLVTALLDDQLAVEVEALRREATTHVVFVGTPPPELAHLVDRRVDAALDWRSVDALPLAGGGR
jgi:uncharacterized protein (DUF58 family)